MGWFRVLIETWWWVLLGAAIGYTAAWFLQRANVAEARRSRVEAEADAAIIRTETESRLERSDERLRLVERKLRDRNGDVEELEHARARDVETIAKLKADAARHLGQIDQRDEALHNYRVDLATQTSRVAQLERALEVSRRESSGIDLRRNVDADETLSTRSSLVSDHTVAPSTSESGSARLAASTGSAAVGMVEATSVAPVFKGTSRFEAVAASAALGRKVVEDDMTIIEGVGPKIASLLEMAGVRTWRGLAAASVHTLQEVLNDAGPAFRMHDPATWPDQARLAADGQFSELADLQQRLDGGRR